MPSVHEQIAQLEAALTAQEALRPTLGDAVVEVTLTALRAQLESLRRSSPAQVDEAAPPGLRPSAAQRSAAATPEQLLERLQSYLPKELADKMRATGRIEGERKQVTVMFADIYGFTALSERLDPEEVTTLTNEALKEMAEAVYQYEGYIDKFLGDAVMAVFGAPVVHEDDPERALRAALAMRERLEGFNRRWIDRLGQPLSLHIGINTGTVIAGNVGSDLRLSYTVMGDTVNTASRLEDASQPGQILVSRDTYRLTQAAFTFLALDPITVKGKREPLSVFELQRAKLHPGKSRGLKGLHSSLVGREREMAQLRHVLAELEAGRGHIVMITGEAGIGKSRLTAEWHEAVTAGDRVLWLEGRAFTHTTSLAYGPFLDLFRRYAGISDDDTEAEARARLHDAVEDIFPGNLEAQAVLAHTLAMHLSPEEEALLDSLPAATFRWRLFALVEEFLTRLARKRPVILVIEDLHWADLTSIELIEYLLLVLGGHLPLTVVGVARLRPDEPLNKLLHVVQARHADRYTHIPLAPLSETSSLEMVEQLLYRRSGDHSLLPEALRAAILRKAEGNPFFVEEVIRSLIERGALVRSPEGSGDGNGWLVTPLMESVTVPDTLQGVLMARLDRLPNETKWAVQQAAVIGRTFLYRVLLYMADNAASLDADLTHLERNELIRERAREPEIEYIFKHALTQEVAYQSLLAPRRKELHRRAGEAMEALFSERISEFGSIVAAHYLQAEVWDKAVDYLLQTGDAAARLYAYTEASSHYTQALEALSHLPNTEDNRRRRVDITVKRVSVSIRTDGPKQCLAWLTEAEILAKSLPSADKLRLARVHYWMGRAHDYLNDVYEAVNYFRQVLPVAQEFDDEEMLAIPSSATGQLLFTQGHLDKAEQLLRQSIPSLEKTANWPYWITSVAHLGGTLAGKGRYTQGLAEVERALERAEELNNLTGIFISHLCFAITYRVGGDMSRTFEESRTALELAEKSGDQAHLCWGHTYQAWAASRLGHPEAAVQHMAQAQAARQAFGGRLIGADTMALVDAEIALNAGRLEDALSLAQAASEVAQAVDGVFAEGLAHRVWGQALAATAPPQWAEAEAHLAKSLRLLESGEVRLEAARTHVAWGKLCRHRGDFTGAREHFEKAAAQFEVSRLIEELERAQSDLAELV
jgi:class 3 adenylate cyclase/tetratricopeptide (TPR) repeat protein